MSPVSVVASEKGERAESGLADDCRLEVESLSPVGAGRSSMESCFAIVPGVIAPDLEGWSGVCIVGFGFFVVYVRRVRLEEKERALRRRWGGGMQGWEGKRSG